MLSSEARTTPADGGKITTVCRGGMSWKINSKYYQRLFDLVLSEDLNLLRRISRKSKLAHGKFALGHWWVGEHEWRRNRERIAPGEHGTWKTSQKGGRTVILTLSRERAFWGRCPLLTIEVVHRSVGVYLLCNIKEGTSMPNRRGDFKGTLDRPW